LAVYVDPLRVYREDRGCGVPTSHLATDGPLEELHAFAASIGLPRMAFHGRAKHPHYDVRAEHRARAVAAGAIEVTSKELVRTCFLRRDE
jgi:hypothetical protein